MKIALFTILFLFGFATQAGTLEFLKKTPASKYEIGTFKAEIMAHFLSEKLNDERVGSSVFRIDRFLVEELEGKLYFVARLLGNARDMNPDVCTAMNSSLLENDTFSSLGHQVWPDLTEEQYTALEDEFIVSTILVSKENETFQIRCDGV